MSDLAHRGAVPPDPTRQAAQRLLEWADDQSVDGPRAMFLRSDVRLVAEAVMTEAHPANDAGMCARDSDAPSYPATPVDCLISELRDLFGMNGRAYLMKDDFEARVAQFKEEVRP